MSLDKEMSFSLSLPLSLTFSLSLSSSLSLSFYRCPSLHGWTQGWRRPVDKGQTNFRTDKKLFKFILND